MFVFLCVLCDSVVSCSPAPPKTEQPPAPTPPPVQESVSYLDEDKSVHGYLCRPAANGTFPAVVLIHDSMGLTTAIKDAAFRLAREDYVVLAVDLYHGQPAKTAKDAEHLERALPKERALGDLKTAVDYLSQRDEVRAKDLGVIGLGMGGGYAFEAAMRDPRLHALVTCYGPLPTEAKRLATLNASVFGIFAENDKSIPPESIARFTTTMDKAGKRLYPLRVYGDCSHGFLDPAYWPLYGKPPEKDVEEAWDLIARYLDRTLM
ncbi:MAG: dienelactone hydrolase family protein [Gemmataceae bacterium]